MSWPCLPPAEGAEELAGKIERHEHWPICSVHLWFDREITELDHAVLLDREVHWMFNQSRLQKRGGYYIELVVSASKGLIERSRSEVVELALKETREFFLEARSAALIKSAVIKELHATYSPRPGIDAYRPPQSTAWPRVFVAGDFTATGWPATMEGAVRSGYLAAEALVRTAGKQLRFLYPDMPASGFMWLFQPANQDR